MGEDGAEGGLMGRVDGAWNCLGCGVRGHGRRKRGVIMEIGLVSLVTSLLCKALQEREAWQFAS